MNNIVEREIDGILYKAQFKGLAFAIKIIELSENKSSLQISRILFDEVLISPKVDIDDFADIASYEKVYDFLLEVARGEFDGKPRSKAKIKKKVKENWACWRLVFCDMANFTYDYVFNQMTPQEIEDANTALDLISEEIKKQSKRKH